MTLHATHNAGDPSDPIHSTAQLIRAIHSLVAEPTQPSSDVSAPTAPPTPPATAPHAEQIAEGGVQRDAAERGEGGQACQGLWHCLGRVPGVQLVWTAHGEHNTLAAMSHAALEGQQRASAGAVKILKLCIHVARILLDHR